MSQLTEITLKLDTSVLREAIQEFLQPGAVLMSASAIRAYAEANGIAPEVCVLTMQAAGGVLGASDSTGKPGAVDLDLPSAGVADRQVQHVDTDEHEEPAGVLPPHVWLYRNMLTDLQRLAPLGVDETNGQVAVAVDDLTQEQRAIPHVQNQLVVMGGVVGDEARTSRAERLRENNTQSDAG